MLAKPVSLWQIRNVPADQIHDSAEGYSFVSLARSQELTTLRTMRPFVLILKGFVKHKLDDVTQLILTVFDHVTGRDEPRALTLINMAADDTDFICKTHNEAALEIEYQEETQQYAKLSEKFYEGIYIKQDFDLLLELFHKLFSKDLFAHISKRRNDEA